MNTVSTEDVLNKAYRLAYFIHQDKSMAIRIVTDATLKLNVAMAVQSKRLYYIPVGRFSPGESRRTDGIRNKALFSDLHLLQRLIYIESEPYERQKERAAQFATPGVHAVGDPASNEDLLVYFIKHLVRITTKRNAFYVTLGVSRLLHSYSTFETMEIYNAVIGEPERVKDDYYYRSRKAVLMHEMCQRFGQLIRACRQRRGEERFEAQQGSREQHSLVRECLRLFTPWDTQCPVPRDFDPLKSVIAALTSKSSTDENKVEVKRIHAVLHPDCFERLVAAFHYSPPEERMELPRFFSNQTDDQSPPGPRSAPADLNAEELAEINDILAEQARRRRRSSTAGVIRIIVDGIERARLNPSEQSSTSFSVEDDSEMIEVKTTDSSGDLLLATHLLTSFGKDAHNAVIVSSIRLEGGQFLSLSIAKKPIDSSGGIDLQIKFGYQEADPRRAFRLWWQRLNLRFSSEEASNSRSLWEGSRISARHILAGSAVIIICLTSYLGYVRLRSGQTNGPGQIVQTNPSGQDRSISSSPGDDPAKVNGPDKTAVKATAPDRTTTQPRQVRNDRSTAAKGLPKNRTLPGADAIAQTREEDAADVTRSGSAVPNLTLKEVKKIYLEIRGDETISEVRSNLVEGLGSSGVVAATTNADAADAALKIVILQTSDRDVRGERQIEASALLVNARGTVLWPKAGRGARRYSGQISKVVSEITRDLLSDIRLAN